MSLRIELKYQIVSCNDDLQVSGNVFFNDKGGLRTDCMTGRKMKTLWERCLSSSTSA